MNNLPVSLIAAAFCLALSGGAYAAPATATKSDYVAATTSIDAKYKTEKKDCKAQSGNARDICLEEAKGRARIARAEYEESYGPSAEHRYELRIAKAEAAYAVAKEKCDDFAGNAKDVCRKEAKAAFIGAKADAKLADATADANATAREKANDANAVALRATNEARQEAVAEKREGAYGVAQEKCDALAGDAKDKCVNDAKTRYGQ
ncbi:hypothetical protein [Rhodocyclus tenuis]|uniref:hypothetical protein n=1 Tax=Rhodocyclus tenuis TaxID=1066 RepID=UPI0019061B59|nr:hypothetical protein [Rhodocyclus tenuis]MBK1679592.1 hypothetical protein [Rhodocyclus tenuis]